jgi:Spy/CpxP family protein refolding chaperone
MSGFEAYAQPARNQELNRPMKKGMAMKGRIENVMKELNLSDKQKSEIKALRLENQRKAVDLKAALEKIKLDNMEMLNSGAFDKDKFLKSVEAENKITNEMKYNGAVLKTKIYDLLDESQKKIWLKHAEAMMAMKGAVKDRIQKRFAK